MRVFSLALCFSLLAATVPSLAPAEPLEDSEQVRLSLDRYQTLLRAAQRQGGPQGQWGRATLAIRLPEAGGHSAQVTFEGNVSLPEGVDDALELPLLPADVALEKVSVGGQSGALSRNAGMHVLVASGSNAVRLEYRVAVLPGPDGGLSVVVPVPPVPSAGVSVTGTGRIEAFPLSNADSEDGSLSGTMPAGAALLVRWGAATATGLRRIEYVLRPDTAGDGVDITATYDVLAGPLPTELTLEPTSVALADLRDGDRAAVSRVQDEHHMLTVTGRGRHTVEATYRVAVDRSGGQPQVTLHPGGAPMTRVEVQVDGKRQVSMEPPVPVRVAQKGNNTVAVGELPPGDEVSVSWTETREAAESQTNTETYQLLTLAEGVLRSRVLVKAEVIHGKIKELPLEIPADVVVFKVVGEGVRAWEPVPEQGGKPRSMRILFAREMDGEVNAEVQLEMRAPQTPGSDLSLPLLRPVGAFREMGVVALFDGDKVGFGPIPAGGAFTAAGEDALPPEIRQTLKDKVSQAFKHVGEPGPLATKVVAATSKEVRFDARVQTLYQVKEGSLVGNAQIMVELKSGRRDHILISLPEGVAEPRINAPSLNKFEAVKDKAAGDGRKAYDVRFTQALEGAIQMDVELEMLLPKDLGAVKLPDVRVHGAEVEEGSIAVTAETGIEVQAGALTELRRVEVKELPNALTLRSAAEIVLGYHYVHAPWSLEMTIKRHQTVETLNASAEHAWIETAVLDNGHLVTRSVWQVANDDKQFMRVVLPKESRVLTVKVDAVAVRAVADESGAIAIPLPKGRTMRVEVSFENVRDKLGWLGRLALQAPHPDVRVSDLQWLVCTPGETAIFGTYTDLKAGPGGAYRPSSEEPPGHVPCAAPFTGDVLQALYTWPVEDAGDAPLTISMFFTTAGGGTFDAFLSLLVIGTLTLFMWRRTQGRKDRATFALLAGGLVLLTLKAFIGTLTPATGLGIAAALLAIGILLRRWARGRPVPLNEYAP